MLSKAGDWWEPNDADPCPQWDPCVVAAMDKFTQTTSPVEEKGRLDPCLDRLLLLFWAHYIEEGPH